MLERSIRVENANVNDAVSVAILVPSVTLKVTLNDPISALAVLGVIVKTLVS